MPRVEDLVGRVRGHRLYGHPIWTRWQRCLPPAPVTGALFHQWQKFCASTRPGFVFPEGLRNLGWFDQSDLIERIATDEQGHGTELARMAGHIVNRCDRTEIFPDVSARRTVEAGLKAYSDQLLGSLPGYDRYEGLTAQAAAAINVFERRGKHDPVTTVMNLGTALALAVTGTGSIIAGQKRALVDSGHYQVSIDDPEMRYLRQHRESDETDVVHAVATVLDEETGHLIERGVDDFLDSVSALLDLLDSALLVPVLVGDVY